MAVGAVILLILIVLLILFLIILLLLIALFLRCISRTQILAICFPLSAVIAKSVHAACRSCSAAGAELSFTM